MAVTGTNRWDLLDPLEVGRWAPRMRASVVLPYYDSLEPLRRTLVALSAQTYPTDLTEVIVVDDGSPRPLELSHLEGTTDVMPTIINRPDEGFRLAAARNEGADAATGDVLVFLDHDMLADPGWLESHMRWHHVSERAVVLGRRSHVDSEWLTEGAVREAASAGGLGVFAAGHEVQVPEWIEFHMRRTANLTSDDDDIFRVVTGGNLSVSKGFFDAIGGFDESFVRWGGEDTEFGYRAWVKGALLVPEEGAHCWHQGLGVVPDEGEQTSQEIQRSKLAHLIPIPGFRPDQPGRIWERPRVVAEISGEDPQAILASAQSLLQITDVAVVVEAAHPLLTEELGPDPRVAIGPEADHHQYSPFRAQVPAGLAVSSSLLDTLLTTARRSGSASTRDGVVVVSQRHVATETLAKVDLATSAGTRRRVPTGADRLLGRLRRIKTPADVLRTARWVFEALRRRSGGAARARSPGARAAPASPRPLARDPWSRVLAVGLTGLPATGRADDERLDLVVTDDTAEEGQRPDVRHLRVSESPQPDLLRHPPLDPGAALRAVRGESANADPLLLLLTGEVPEATPPGPRTKQAVSLARSRAEDDIAGLESIRRAVLAEHLGPMRLDQLRVAAGLHPSAPKVSIVVASRRAETLPLVIEAIADQTYPYLELILGLHGTELADEVDETLRAAGVDFTVVTAPAQTRFGTVLAMASERASGDLLAKMDDDDLYSRTHIEDLVNARLISGADLVGKAAEFVHLEASDLTIRRFVGGAYTESRTIAGGAMAITREAYEAAGGWADVVRHVDQALIRDVLAGGGTVFRTHGLGYVLVRHGDHTWQSDEDRFLSQAEDRWSGIPDWILADLPPDEPVSR